MNGKRVSIFFRLCLLAAIVASIIACSDKASEGAPQKSSADDTKTITQQSDESVPANVVAEIGTMENDQGLLQTDTTDAANTAPNQAEADLAKLPPAQIPDVDSKNGAHETDTLSKDDSVPAEPASPKQYTVKGVVTQWSPMVLFVQPGDQIVFRQMAGHDVETIEGMFPTGAKVWKSKMGQEGFAVSPEMPGVYIYKCNPHVSLGMIGAVVVGETPPANLADLESHPQNKGMVGRAIRKLKQALATNSAE